MIGSDNPKVIFKDRSWGIERTVFYALATKVNGTTVSTMLEYYVQRNTIFYIPRDLT